MTTEAALAVALGTGLFLLTESTPERKLDESRKRQLTDGQVHQKQFLERPHDSQAEIDRASRSLLELFRAIGRSQTEESRRADQTFAERGQVNNAPRNRPRGVPVVLGQGHRTLVNPTHKHFHHAQGQAQPTLQRKKFLRF